MVRHTYVGEWDAQEPVFSSVERNDNNRYLDQSPALDFSFSPRVSNNEEDWAGFELELDMQKVSAS